MSTGAFFSLQALTPALAQAPAPKPESTAKPKPKPAPKPTPKAEQPAPTQAQQQPQQQPNFVIVDHAQKAGIKTCLHNLQSAATATIDAEQSGISIWSQDAADKHIFVGRSYATYQNQNAPRSLSIVSAAPVADNKCDVASVRIQPSALSCDQIAANLKTQNVPEPILAGDTRMYPIMAAGQRTTLMRAATNEGCVVITEIVAFGP